MNNDSISTGIEPVSEVPVQKTGWRSILTRVSDKIPPKFKEIFAKFYANKKVFWPITIVFGILFLVIILGLIFGTKTPPTVRNFVTPAPFIESTPEATASGDILTVTGNQLRDLKIQIDTLDLKQSRLAPPTINYDISF